MGWSLFPVAYLPGQSTFEVSMTSLQFDASLFELSNGATFEKKTIQVPTTGNYEVTNGSVVLKTDESIKSTIDVDGLALGEQVGDGTYTVTETAPADEETQYTTTIAVPDGISNLLVTYFENKEVSAAGIDNRSTAIGQMTMIWPVYGSGDEENAIRGADIKGYVMEIIYRARITQGAGFNTSYKNVTGNQITVGAMDPHRADEQIYMVAYFDK